VPTTGLGVALLLGRIVFGAYWYSTHDPTPTQPRMDGVVASPYGGIDPSFGEDDGDDGTSEAQVGDCYTSDHLATDCAGPHVGEIVISVAVRDSAAGRADADRRCAEVVEAALGGSAPAGTEVFGEPALGDWEAGIRPVDCHVATPPGGEQLVGRLAPIVIDPGACYSAAYEVTDCYSNHLGEIVDYVRLGAGVDADIDVQQAFYQCLATVNALLSNGLPEGFIVVARPIATISPEGNGTFNCAVEPASGEPTLGNPVRLL
jgi:hypothetical protein